VAAALDHSMTTTAFVLDGYKTTKTIGVVRGVTVRSRSILGTIGASLQQPLLLDDTGQLR